MILRKPIRSKGNLNAMIDLSLDPERRAGGPATPPAEERHPNL
jgi:hypothetical protein